MPELDTYSSFDTTLLCPKNMGDEAPWAFVVLPLQVSEKLPRRGRMTVNVLLNGHAAQVLLEPDGQKSHWFKVDNDWLKETGCEFDQRVQIELDMIKPEPEPEVPQDLNQALHNAPDALNTWLATTTIARIDWIHWIVTAKQAKTRDKRIHDACDMLAKGKKRVCCFDPSGFYSKAFGAPKTM
ncbi:DUF1905 domain-containing protein [Neptunicella marina]|uniref:DUF1905 domain-containing protein n=1 Tax=Neptunicella marina TaxID=2125989 RepID=A0A8J6IUT9_9ALTE|nr:DUF1905 domain-containing protein [Neptunicella marina]